MQFFKQLNRLDTGAFILLNSNTDPTQLSDQFKSKIIEVNESYHLFLIIAGKSTLHHLHRESKDITQIHFRPYCSLAELLQKLKITQDQIKNDEVTLLHKLTTDNLIMLDDYTGFKVALDKDHRIKDPINVGADKTVSVLIKEFEEAMQARSQQLHKINVAQTASWQTTVSLQNERVRIRGNLSSCNDRITAQEMLRSKLKAQYKILDARNKRYHRSLLLLSDDGRERWKAHAAVHQGDLIALKTYLNKKPTLIDSQDADGNTPLHFAAAYGNKQMIQLLLALNANQKLKNKEELSAADLDYLNSIPHTEAMLQVYRNCAIAMIDYANSPTPTSLTLAVTEIANLPSDFDFSLADESGSTLLHKAIDACSTDLVHRLLDKGCPVDLVNHDGETPLSCTELLMIIEENEDEKVGQLEKIKKMLNDKLTKSSITVTANLQ